MNRCRALLFSAVAILGALSPAFAGEVFVPLASNRNVGNTIYRTKVWVSNTSNVARRFSATFYEQGTNGNNNNATPSSLTVAPNGTLLLSAIAPDGRNGMLEVNGAPQLVVTARVEAIGPGGVVISSAQVPVVSKENLLAANAVAHLQGLKQTTAISTQFGLLNMSRTAAQCTVRGYRADGTQIGSAAILPVPALSSVHFDDALLALGGTNLSDARFEATCDKSFYTYAMVFSTGGPETSFITPAGALENDLVPGGSGGPVTPGAVTFEANGLFLNAKNGDSFVQFDLPLQPGKQYRKATVDFDMFLGKFPDGLFSGVTAMRRTDKTLFFGLIVRGDRQKTLLDMGVHDDVVQGSNGGPWRERSNYHIRFEYDTASGILTSIVSRGGAVVETLTGRINHFDLNPKDKIMRVDFGQKGVADGAYFPPVGWQFSNLKVVFEP
jgi:hypothetical protein